MGEHLPCKQGVMGSNPIISNREGPIKEPGDNSTAKLQKMRAMGVDTVHGLIAQLVRARA